MTLMLRIRKEYTFFLLLNLILDKEQKPMPQSLIPVLTESNLKTGLSSGWIRLILDLMVMPLLQSWSVLDPRCDYCILKAQV